MNRSNQSGSVLAIVLFGLGAVGVLATLAYGAYYQIARGTQDTVDRARASALLTQAAYTLATEASDSDADGISEPPAGLVVLGDGWDVPASSGAPKADPWGSQIKYCPSDNGSTNSSSGRLTGANPALPSSVQFALVSAGPDRSLSTSCAQAAAGTTLGDDGTRVMTVAQLNQGVGGTVYFGDPVADVASLPATAQTGTLRIVRDAQIPYLWNGSAWLPLNAGAWLVVTGGASCAAYPAGTLARDAADDLFICTTVSRVWKSVK